MKIALYGMPCAGKSTLMDRITDAKVINGSQELRRICGGSFLELSEEEKHQVRIKYTEYINGLNDEVIVSDGHYSFMETVAFTEADGDLYDIFIYLYCSPENLKERYALSEKNAKFAGESIMCYDEQFHSCIVRAAKCKTLYKIWAMLRESNLCGYYTMGVESIIPFDVFRYNHEILLKGIKELPVEKTAKLIEEHYMIVPEVLHEKQCKKSE